MQRCAKKFKNWKLSEEKQQKVYKNWRDTKKYTLQRLLIFDKEKKKERENLYVLSSVDAKHCGKGKKIQSPMKMA